MVVVVTGGISYPASRGFFLASLSACAKSFASHYAKYKTCISRSRLVYFAERNLCREPFSFSVSCLAWALDTLLEVDQVTNRLKTGLNEFVNPCASIFLLIFCAKMSLREVERWLTKVFLVYVSTKHYRRL